MKLCLIFSVLLLASLASAKPTPPVKVLYDPARHVLIEIDNATSIYYTYFESRFIFKTQLSESSNESRIVLQKKKLLALLLRHSRINYPSKHETAKKSTEQLSDLIDECNGNLRLRMLTEEEKDQILLYKVEQAESKKLFEVTYDKLRSIIKLSEISHVQFEDSVGFEDDERYIAFRATPNSGGTPHGMHFTYQEGGRSFVIEPASREEACSITGLEEDVERSAIVLDLPK